MLQTARTRTLRCSVRNHGHHGTVLYCTALLYSTTPPLRSILALRYSTAMHNRTMKRTEISNTHSRNTHKKREGTTAAVFYRSPHNSRNILMSACRAGFAAWAERNDIFALRRKCPASVFPAACANCSSGPKPPDRSE